MSRGHGVSDVASVAALEGAADCDPRDDIPVGGRANGRTGMPTRWTLIDRDRYAAGTLPLEHGVHSDGRPDPVRGAARRQRALIVYGLCTLLSGPPVAMAVLVSGIILLVIGLRYQPSGQRPSGTDSVAVGRPPLHRAALRAGVILAVVGSVLLVAAVPLLVASSREPEPVDWRTSSSGGWIGLLLALGAAVVYVLAAVLFIVGLVGRARRRTPSP